MERDPFKIQKENIVYNFNSHAHVERDSRSKIVPIIPVYFNSHAHVERDKSLSIRAWSAFNFNSHAHVERDSLL